MLVYGSISVNTITYVTVAITTGTVLLCYALAVGLGHVPAWLPLISDCAVEAPEKYPFRIGVIFGAVALFANVVLVYWAFPSFSYRRTSTAFGLAASVAFAIVGAINEKENDVAHSTSAVCFFVFYDIYMTIIVLNSPRDQRITRASLINKRIFVLIGNVLLITAILFAVFGWERHLTEIAMCEWCGFLAIESFNLTFAADLADLKLEELSNDGMSACVGMFTHSLTPPRYIRCQTFE
ncbi:DNA damage-regulated autophagy modulator protein 1-like [Oscarella lobularis]|uniref:DNA damage-regulated autophagy modulator protein 1-like n=1 Tax=Oscarella lobularis TaxID=121494 RepID=UPI0033144624